MSKAIKHFLLFFFHKIFHITFIIWQLCPYECSPSIQAVLALFKEDKFFLYAGGILLSLVPSGGILLFSSSIPEKCKALNLLAPQTRISKILISVSLYCPLSRGHSFWASIVCTFGEFFFLLLLIHIYFSARYNVLFAVHQKSLTILYLLYENLVRTTITTWQLCSLIFTGCFFF